MKKVFLAVAMITAIAGYASAQDDGRWRLVGESASGNQIEVDTETVVRKGDLVTAWVRTTYAGKRPEGVPLQAAYSTTRLRFECEAMSVTMLAFVTYSAEGQSLESFNHQGSAKPVIPESVNEVIWSALCKG